MKFRLATIALVLGALAATTSPAYAGVTCSTDATAAISGASVNGPRAGWTPPVWTFDMPSLSMSVDVQADTLSDAQSKATSWMQEQVQAACAAEQASAPSGGSATTNSTSSTSTTSSEYPQASSLVASAPVTYVGNSWGPLPVWRLAFPSINLTVDVQAADESGARSAAIPAVASAIGEQPASGTSSATTAAATDSTTTDAVPQVLTTTKTMTAGSWTGTVDAESGIPVAAGIPQ